MYMFRVAHSLKYFIGFVFFFLLLNIFAFSQTTDVLAIPPAGPTPIRPLDYNVTIEGAHTIGEIVEFVHPLGPNPATLHPVWVYSEDRNTLWGVGRYAIDFGDGTLSSPLLGDGSDGPVTISGSQPFAPPSSPLATTALANQNELVLEDATGIATGDELFLYQIQGGGVGTFEFLRVADKTGNTLTTTTDLQYTYTQTPTDKTLVMRVMNYTNVTILGNSTWIPNGWDGTKGGILLFRANGTVLINGSISATSMGYREGGGGSPTSRGQQGESYSGTGSNEQHANGGGGGGGGPSFDADGSDAGGGGGFATNGTDGTAGGGGTSETHTPGRGGAAYGTLGSAALYLGSGGGGGGGYQPAGYGGDRGGRGGGSIVMFANNVVVQGQITTNGENGSASGNPQNGSHRKGAGGGGSAGSIYIVGSDVALGSNLVTAFGGSGGTNQEGGTGGTGSHGRILVEYCNPPSGATAPAATMQRLDCSLAYQSETSPNMTRLRLPETFSDGRTYNLQYGRLYLFQSGSELIRSIRVPVGAWTNVTLDAMVSNVAPGSVILDIDIGNDGEPDWMYNGTLNSPTILSSINLASVFTEYWQSQGSPQTGTLDVPVRIGFNTAGQVLLSNLEMMSVVPPATATPSQTSTPNPTNTPTQGASPTATVTGTSEPSATTTVTSTPFLPSTITPTRTPTTIVVDGEVFIPLVLRNYAFATPLPTYTPAPTCMTLDQEPNNLFLEADNHLPLCRETIVHGSVAPTTDVNDIYRLIVTEAGDTVINLANIPAGADYDLYLYDARGGAGQLAVSNAPGSSNEVVRLPLIPGRYYVRVVSLKYAVSNTYQLQWSQSQE